MLVYGLSNKSWNQIPLPWDLGQIGALGCFLYVDVLDSVWTTTSPLTGTVGFQLSPSPVFLNTHVYAQLGVFDPSLNPAGVITSNGVDLLVGH